MNFLERIKDNVLTGDGAIGTMLYNKGVSLDANFEHLNLVRPDLVLDLHREYLEAGAQILETNTFGANYTKLAAIGLGAKVASINRRGVELARRAASEGGFADVFIAGSIGPLIRPKGDEKELSATEMMAVFREQSVALAEGGVNLFILETFSDLEQLKIAISAVREADLPIVASMAYQEGGHTAGGAEVELVAAALAAAGADVVGANCGAGPLEVLQNVRRMSTATELPLAAFANSGFPEFRDGRYIYRATPEYFAERAKEMAKAGACLIGGCCGTTPEHIRRIAEQLKGMRPTRRTVPIRQATSEHRTEPEKQHGGFLSRWGKEPVVTVELDPPKGLDCSKVVAGSRALKKAGADAINLAENPLARVRMGNIALANLIQREVGIDVIVHITCRDRNLLGLQSDLMGASLLGIRYILAVTGDPARLGEHAGATSVYDLNSFSLIKLLSDLNAGVNGLGSPIGGGAGFTIGAAFNPNTLKMEVQAARLAKKIANGATFAQTQPLYDPARLDEMLMHTGPLGIPILPGILPLVSERNCEYLHNEVPGITIPDDIRLRMRGKEKEAGVREGMAIAVEFIEEVKHRVGGFYLIPPFGRWEIAAELVKFIKSPGH